MAGGVGNDLLIGDFRSESAGGNDRLNGGANADQLFGGAADDIVVGGVGGNQLFGDYRAASGSDGNDIMAGGAGDDQIHGGGGSGDVVVFLGARSEYEVVRNTDGSFTVTDTVADRAGIDTVEAVETFLFADGYIAAPDVVASTGGSGFGMQQATATLTIDIPFVNDAPDDVVFAGGPLAEDTAVGTLVEIAIGHDPDGDDQILTYALLDDAGGLFTINPNTGAVRLAGALDFETAASHMIEIQVEDAAGAT